LARGVLWKTRRSSPPRSRATMPPSRSWCVATRRPLAVLASWCCAMPASAVLPHSGSPDAPAFL